MGVSLPLAHGGTTHLPNRNLFEKVTGPIHTVIHTWEANRDVPYCANEK
jgi:hypothetical protein